MTPETLNRREWTILYNQNGDEYTGTMTVKAHNVTQMDDKTVLADGVRIELDEDIQAVIDDKGIHIERP